MFVNSTDIFFEKFRHLLLAKPDSLLIKFHFNNRLIIGILIYFYFVLPIDYNSIFKICLSNRLLSYKKKTVDILPLLLSSFFLL